MTQAGWYPDPAGQPQTYRYWDGTSWSQETTGDPYAPPPAPPAPPPPPVHPVQPPTPTTAAYGAVPPPPSGGYAQPPAFGGGFPPAPPPGGGRSAGTTIVIVVVAVLVLAGLSTAGFFGYRALTGDDGNDTDAVDRTSATDTATTGPTDATTPTDPTDPTTPTDTSTTGDTEVTDQQCLGGVPTPSVTPDADAEEVSGGGLSFPVPRGYTADTSYAAAFKFADDFTPLQKVIEQAGSDYGWVSIYGVGGLRKANGFDDPAQAAEVVMTCMAQSQDLYQHFTGREDLSSGAVTVDGSSGYQITSEIRVDDPQLTVEGDVAQVVVVDTGDPDQYGVYITVVPIGDERLIRQQKELVDSLTVD